MPEEEEESAESRGRRRPGPLVSPGEYPVTLELRGEDGTRTLAGPVVLRVIPFGRTRYVRISDGR
jgi:hypothetical protein